MANHRTSRSPGRAPDDSTTLGNDVLAIARGADGQLWVSARLGLFVFDPRRESFERVSDELHTRLVFTLLRGRDGLLWIGTEDELLAVEPRSRRVLHRFSSATGAQAAPIAGRVLALYQGPKKTIWVGSDGGLASLDPSSGSFTNYRYDRDDPLSLGGNIVRSVLVDRGGVLWVGLETYGVSKHAPSAVHFEVIRHDPSAPRSLSDGYVRGTFLRRFQARAVIIAGGGVLFSEAAAQLARVRRPVALQCRAKMRSLPSRRTE